MTTANGFTGSFKSTNLVLHATNSFAVSVRFTSVSSESEWFVFLVPFGHQVNFLVMRSSWLWSVEGFTFSRNGVEFQTTANFATLVVTEVAIRTTDSLVASFTAITAGVLARLALIWAGRWTVHVVNLMKLNDITNNNNTLIDNTVRLIESTIWGNDRTTDRSLNNNFRASSVENVGNFVAWMWERRVRENNWLQITGFLNNDNDQFLLILDILGGEVVNLGPVVAGDAEH